MFASESKKLFELDDSNSFYYFEKKRTEKGPLSN